MNRRWKIAIVAGAAAAFAVAGGGAAIAADALSREGSTSFGPSHLAHPHSLETAASFLGMTEAELADGESLADVAKAEGKPVDGLVQALVAGVEERLDEAVDDGRLTQAQADEFREDLEKRITEFVNREPGTGPGFRDRRFRAGPHHVHGCRAGFSRPRG